MSKLKNLDEGKYKELVEANKLKDVLDAIEKGKDFVDSNNIRLRKLQLGFLKTSIKEESEKKNKVKTVISSTKGVSAKKASNPKPKATDTKPGQSKDYSAIVARQKKAIEINDELIKYLDEITYPSSKLHDDNVREIRFKIFNRINPAFKTDGNDRNERIGVGAARQVLIETGVTITDEELQALKVELSKQKQAAQATRDLKTGESSNRRAEITNKIKGVQKHHKQSDQYKNFNTAYDNYKKIDVSDSEKQHDSYKKLRLAENAYGKYLDDQADLVRGELKVANEFFNKVKSKLDEENTPHLDEVRTSFNKLMSNEKNSNFLKYGLDSTDTDLNTVPLEYAESLTTTLRLMQLKIIKLDTQKNMSNSLKNISKRLSN